MAADWKDLQKRVYQNKLDHNFNTTDVNLEFCYLYGEVGEAHAAWREQKPDMGEELADIAIYLLGLAEILGVDLEDEVVRKMEINRRRRYERVNGVVRKYLVEDGEE